MSEQIEKLKRLNGELCAEVNEKGKRIRELETENDELLEAWSNQAKTIYEQIKRIAEMESLVRDMWEYLSDPATEFPCCEPVCDMIRERIAALEMEVDR